jgi:hypothetical protein
MIQRTAGDSTMKATPGLRLPLLKTDNQTQALVYWIEICNFVTKVTKETYSILRI